MTSGRDVREADLFWAALVGEPVSEPVAPPSPPRPMPMPTPAPRPMMQPPRVQRPIAQPPPAQRPIPQPSPAQRPIAQPLPAPARPRGVRPSFPAFRIPPAFLRAYGGRPPITRALREDQEDERYEQEDALEAADLPGEAVPSGLTASPCDVSKTSETLDQFDHNGFALKPAHRPIITRLAGCLNALRVGPRPIRDVHVVGFTDPSGSPSTNQTLGENRAKAVRDALRTALGATAASFNLLVASNGEADQIPGGDAPNRRVEVFVDVAVTDLVVHATDPNTHEIPSNLGAGGVEHFCCVKNTGDIVIEALISPAIPGSITGRLTWAPAGTVTSPGVGTDGRTAKLSSAAAGKFPIQLSWDGAIVRRAVAWVIWSDITVTCTRPPTTQTSATETAISAGIDHTFTVDPPEIITDADRPALDGPPTAPVPGAALRHVISNNPLSGGASKKWDVSRQIRIKILNPHLYPVAQLSVIAGHLWNGQPAAVTTPENYPADEAQGNDDSNVCDETKNPYENCGWLTSVDDPTMVMRNATGANGQTFERRYHFREFMRVNLGPRWYRASDYSLWRFHGRFRRAAGAWGDNVSTFARDNAGF